MPDSFSSQGASTTVAKAPEPIYPFLTYREPCGCWKVYDWKRHKWIGGSHA